MTDDGTRFLVGARYLGILACPWHCQSDDPGRCLPLLEAWSFIPGFRATDSARPRLHQLPFGLHRRLARALETYPAPSFAERVLGILVLLSVPAIFLAAAA